MEKGNIMTIIPKYYFPGSMKSEEEKERGY